MYLCFDKSHRYEHTAFQEDLKKAVSLMAKWLQI